MRGRMLAFIAAMLLGVTAHASEAYIVNAGGWARLVDGQGGALVEDADAEHIFEVWNGLFAIGREGSYWLSDAHGKRACDGRFEMAWSNGEALILRQKGLYGAMAATGRWLIEPKWHQLVPTGRNTFLALDGSALDDQPDEVVFVSSKSGERRTGIQTTVGLRLPVGDYSVYRDEEGRYGYLDAQGNAVIEPSWRYAGDFVNGLAIVSDGEAYGAIDGEGSTVIPLSYRWLARDTGILAGITPAGKADVYDAETGALRYSVNGVEQVNLLGNAVSILSEEGVRLFDGTGKCLYEADGSARISKGLNGCYIVSDGPWGALCQWLIDENGAAVSDRYQCLLPLCGDRYAYMTMSGVQYRSDILDATQTSWDYGSVRFGLMDGDGRRILEPVYREIRAAGEDRLLITDEMELHFADLEGNILASWPLE